MRKIRPRTVPAVARPADGHRRAAAAGAATAPPGATLKKMTSRAKSAAPGFTSASSWATPAAPASAGVFSGATRRSATTQPSAGTTGSPAACSRTYATAVPVRRSARSGAHPMAGDPAGVSAEEVIAAVHTAGV